MRHIAYCNLGCHRGSKRLYFQTQRLNHVGFAPGAKFSAVFGEGKIVLKVTPEGERTVSGKSKPQGIVPVVDISTTKIDESMGAVNRVRVIYRPQEIVIDLHPQEVKISKREERFRANRREGVITAGTLCSGAGVLDHAIHEGFEAAGCLIDSKFTVEIDAEYLETALVNNSAMYGTMTVEGSLDEIDTDLLPETDLLVVGIPCTGASKAGRSKKGLSCAEEDPHVGHLFVPFLDIVKRTNPAIIILENVVAYQTTVSMMVIRNVLGRMGYTISERILDGADFSLENRKRFSMVAVSRGLSGTDMTIEPKRRYNTLGEVLEFVPLDSDRWKEAAYLAAKEERDIAAGKGFRMQVVGPDATLLGVIGRGYAKWRSTEPRLQHPENPKLTRLFTPTEHARIKGIPFDLVGATCDTTAHELLGQSIIHPAFAALGEAVARSVR